MLKPNTAENSMPIQWAVITELMTGICIMKHKGYSNNSHFP